MLAAILGVLRRRISSRDCEFDDAIPGSARSMTGLFVQLSEKQKQKVLSYRGPEYIGPRAKKI